MKPPFQELQTNNGVNDDDEDNKKEHLQQWKHGSDYWCHNNLKTYKKRSSTIPGSLHDITPYD